jgi:Bacterial pre-peptidase C-terminal domain/Bacterial Ig-like domain
VAALSFDALTGIVRKPRTRRPHRRRRLLELETLEDRTLPSVSQFHPMALILHPTRGGPADSPDPWPTAFAPSDIASLYGLDQLQADGTGMTIAIIDAYDDPKFVSRSSTLPVNQDSAFLASDLHQFDVQYQLPEPPGFFTKLDQTGGTNYPATDPSGAGNPNGNWEYEEALDVEWAHAIAPMAKIVLVEAINDLDLNTTPNLFKAAQYAGGTLGAQVISMSWGDTEWSGELSNDSNNFVQPVGHGVTYVAASGDTGQPSLYPSYSPLVLSVGGTTLNQDFFTGAYSSEDGWSGSGGGPSQYEVEPNYQKAVVPSSMSLVNGKNWRTTPDVAFDADPETGISVYDSYNGLSTGGPWWQVGGTSYSAVAWAGMIALTDQLRANKGLGSLNGPSQTLPTLYKLSASDFHDPVAGNNGYAAGPGFDMVTGRGSPIANMLLPDLANQANLQVVASTPASGASVATSPTQFTITFSDAVNPSTVQGSTLTVNGFAATSVSLDSTDTIATFTFANSPVTAQGKQTMAIAANTVADLGSNTPSNSAFSANFYYDTLPLAIASTTPAAGGTFTLPGSSFTFSVTFNEQIDQTLVSASNLMLSQGTVITGHAQSGGLTVVYTITGLTSEGPLTITMPAGIEDQYDNPTSPTLTATFYVDNGTVALPALTAVAPSGSLGYQTSSSSVILFAGDSDKFTLSADPGELLTVLVNPTSSSLTPTIQLSDPGHAVLASTYGPGPGQNVVLQTVPTTGSGTYTITIGGVGVSTGSYTMKVYLDAALENASQGGAADNTLATAFNLNSAFVALQTPVSSASRAAVVGSVAQPITLNAISQGQWDSTGSHSATNESYEVGQIPPTQYRNYFVFDLSNIGSPITTAALNLTDVTGGYNSPLSSDTYGLFDVSTPISALVASGAGQTGIFNDLGSGTGYGSQTITTASDGTVISTSLSAAGITGLNSGRGGLFAIGGALTSISGSNTQFLFGSSGNATDTTQLVVSLSDSHFYSFTLNAGELATVGLKYLTGGGDTLILEDATGKTLATASAGNASFDQIISNFAAPATGTYYVVVSGSSAAKYDLVVTRDGTLDGKGNSSSSSAQDLTGTAGALGALSTSSATDWYKFVPNASQTSLSLQTATPLAGPSQTINTLKLQIQLYDSSITLVASGTYLPDGNNQTLSAPGLTAGATYFIKVSEVTGQGEYFLSVPQAAASATFSKYVVTAANGASSVTAGSSFLVTVQAADQNGNPITSGYNGPSTVTVSISPTSSASSFPMTIAIGSNGLGFGIANINAVGSYTITAASGAFSGSTGPLAVTAGPATKLGFTTQPVNTPTGGVLPAVTVQVQDQNGNVVNSDNSDVVTLSIASGPAGASFLTASTLTATVTGGMATFNNLTLVAPGTYALGAVVPGKYTGPNSSSFSVTPLQVVAGSFKGTPSGFSLQFNAPFLVNSTTPVLYGTGFGASAPALSVIVTTDPNNLADTAAMAIGSLILNTKTNTITFLATNTALQANNSSPVLPDGIYTVIVRGTAANDGFQALNSGGGFLDGLATGSASGSDFKATFTVNAAAAKDDVVWVPATADGPGQPLKAPGFNQVAGGFPVYLNDSTGKVTHITLNLTYDPTLLNVTGVSSNSALSGSMFQLLAGSTAGNLFIEFNGTSAGAAGLTGGQVPLGFINGTVPAGTTASPTPYKAKDVMHLANVTVGGPSGNIAAVTSDGLHLVAFVGDANGDGAYSSDDAVRITRVTLQTDTGFAPYPLVDPVIVADTDGAGFIPSDAPLQANEAGVGVKTANLANPPIPPGVHFTAIGNNVDPTLSVDIGSGTGDHSTVTVAVNIDDAQPAGSTGLVRGHLALTYDPSVFTVSAADVHLGSVLASGGWKVVPTINQTTGQIAIALSGETPITGSSGGSLIMIDFHAAGEVVHLSTINLVPFATELEDAQGTFTLTFATTAATILGSGSARVDAASVQTQIHLSGANGTSPEPVAAQVNDGPMAPAVQLADVAAGAEETDTASTGGSVPVTQEEPHLQAVAGSHGLAASVSPFTSAAALAGALLEYASPPFINALGLGVTTWQRGSDSLFQALGRSSSDPVFSGAVQIVERALAGPFFLAQTDSDALNELDREMTGRDFISPVTTDKATGRDAADRQAATPSASERPGDQLALDQLFAQEVDDAVARNEP